MKRKAIITFMAIFLTQTSIAGDNLVSYQWQDQGNTRQGWVDNQVGYSGSAGTATLKNYPATVRQRSVVGTPVGSPLLPVVRLGPSSNAPYLVPTGGIIVQTSDENGLRHWATKKQLAILFTGVDGHWRIDTPAGIPSMTLANEAAKLPGVSSSTPEWTRPRSKR